MLKKRTYDIERRKKEFAWIERVAQTLDSKYKIGGFSFGLDPLLNLIPYAGQVTTFGISILLVIVMIRNGAGSKVAVKMLLNTMYDAVMGTIPFFGQVFDFFHKANKKNVTLLKEHYFENKHQGSAKGILISIFAILLFLSIGIVYLMAISARWIHGFLAQLF